MARAAPGFGLLYDFRQRAPLAQAYGSYYAECLAQVQAAEELGYQAVWLSEHHFTPDGFLPAPLVAAAAIAARTSRIRIGTNVVPLPLHHPLRVAEDAAVVDLLSGGRLVLGVGQGHAEDEFAAFGVERGFPLVATGIVHVDRDADRAWDQAAPAIAYLEGGIASYAAGRDGPHPGAAPAELRRADLLVGAPDQVAERLVALHRRAPYDQFAFWGRLPDFTHEPALRSIRLFAAEVAPTVRAGLAGR